MKTVFLRFPKFLLQYLTNYLAELKLINLIIAATIDPWRAPAPSPATVVSPPRTNDPWSPVPSTTTTTESETNKLQVTDLSFKVFKFYNVYNNMCL